MEARRTCILRIVVGLFLFYSALGQTCDRYWLLHEDMCFRHFPVQVSYLEAERQCNSEGAHLVSNLTDGLEFHLLGPGEQNTNLSYWCKTDGDEDFLLTPLILTRKRRSTSCCFIRNMEYQTGECDELRGYICEKDPTPRIHICLQNTATSSNVSDWEGARMYCQCNGGDLYSFNGTSEEEHFLEVTRGQSMWIGLRREAGSNEYLWSDGTPFSHSLWNAGQLSIDDNMELCVAHIEGKNSSWEAVDCSSVLSFMCKPSRNALDISYSEFTTETTPFDVSTDETGTGTSVHNVSDTEDSMEPFDYEDSFEMVTGEDLYNVSYEQSALQTDWYNTSEEDSAMTINTTLDNSPTENFGSEFPQWNTSSQVPTAESSYTNEPMENSTAEAGYISACSPVFEDCYMAGVVLGIIILITALAISVAYSRLRKKKEKNQEAPVQLLHIHSYKEGKSSFKQRRFPELKFHKAK